MMSTNTNATLQHLARAMVLILVVAVALIVLGAPAPTTAQGQQAVRLGEFQVEWYCNQRGYDVILTNNQTDWACTFRGGGIAFVLNQTHFNQICQATYRNQFAYALRDQNKPTPAYNWSCYVNVGPTGYVPVPNARRLGGFTVDWYCQQRGFGAAIVNGGADWACTLWSTNQVALILNQNDFNYICRATYRDFTAYAVRDQSNPTPAYNWSCYTSTSPTPLPPTATPVPPTPTPLPPTAVSMLFPVRLGNLEAQWYCNQRGYDVTMINNQTDWACTFWGTNQTAFVLSQNDLNAICQATYRNPQAFAMRDQNNPTRAYSWSCYVFSTPMPTIVPPTPTPMPAPVRLGEFQVEWYCNQRGYDVALINNQADWACTFAGTTQTAFVLSQNDFNAICQATYRDPQAFAMRDQKKRIQAYNWSCYVYPEG